MSLEQTALAREPGLKIRLGTVNNAGEQKGVDALIVTDLIELARNRAISDAVIVSGDEDLRIAVQVAQSFGVRVHVLAVGEAGRNVSPSLQMEADSVDALDREWLIAHLEVRAVEKMKEATGPIRPPTSSQPIPAAPANLLDAARTVADELLQTCQPGDISALAEHFSTSQSVPPEYDRKLIAKTAGALGRKLEPSEMRQIRGAFVNVVRARAAPK